MKARLWAEIVPEFGSLWDPERVTGVRVGRVYRRPPKDRQGRTIVRLSLDVDPQILAPTATVAITRQEAGSL